jgi:hypothetical protein
MSSICSRVKVICGIVSCGDRKKARSEYWVIEGSAASSGNVGAAKFRDSRSGRVLWHSAHHFSANSFPATASADAPFKAAIAIEIATAKPAPIALRLLIKSSI